jgi:hypothetical protein
VVAKLGKKRVVTLAVPPGAHTISFGGHEVTAEYQAGAEYYLRAGFEGFPVHKTLKAADTELGTAELRAESMQPTDAKHTFATTCGGR